MEKHEAPSKVGDEQPAAFMDKLEDWGRLSFAKLRRDENVALAKFLRRFYPTSVRNAESAKCRKHLRATAQCSRTDAFRLSCAKPANGVPKQGRRVCEMLVCLKVGRVAKIDCASAAVKGRSRGKGARPIQFAVRKGNGIVGKQHERTRNRPAAKIDC